MVELIDNLLVDIKVVINQEDIIKVIKEGILKEDNLVKVDIPIHLPIQLLQLTNLKTFLCNSIILVLKTILLIKLMQSLNFLLQLNHYFQFNQTDIRLVIYIPNFKFNHLLCCYPNRYYIVPTRSFTCIFGYSCIKFLSSYLNNYKWILIYQ